MTAPMWVRCRIGRVGNYRVVDKRRVKVETTTGPGVYEFKISGDLLSFKNDSGCEFRYRRTR